MGVTDCELGRRLSSIDQGGGKRHAVIVAQILSVVVAQKQHSHNHDHGHECQKEEDLFRSHRAAPGHVGLIGKGQTSKMGSTRRYSDDI
jgi:hypothetical protein